MQIGDTCGLVAFKVLPQPSNHQGFIRTNARRWCWRRMCWWAQARWWPSRCCAGSMRTQGRRRAPAPARTCILRELVSELAWARGRQQKSAYAVFDAVALVLSCRMWYT